MIRILVHELIEVGIGLKSITEFEEMIRNKTAPIFLNSAYPQGLYLSQVKYPFRNSLAKPDYCPMMKINRWNLIDPN